MSMKFLLLNIFDYYTVFLTDTSNNIAEKKRIS